MRTATYTIPGNPIPLARPRFGQNRVWDSQKSVKFNAGLFVVNTHNNAPLFSGPLALDVIFYLPKPKTAAKSKIGAYHISRPDLDNLIKMVCDICNGITYNDDATIALIHAIKKYDSTPRTVFTLSEL
jgi:Holliday junction resolvase RusA-like endonuclease